MTNKLYYGDNLHVLREHIADASVDLVYLDPPFNSNANYNILFKSPHGKRLGISWVDASVAKSAKTEDGGRQGSFL